MKDTIVVLLAAVAFGFIVCLWVSSSQKKKVRGDDIIEEELIDEDSRDTLQEYHDN